jgi:DNA-binding transcriptional regulator LsrR (DeoR family)
VEFATLDWVAWFNSKREIAKRLEISRASVHRVLRQSFAPPAS